MKILKDKTYKELIDARDFFKDIYEDSEKIIVDLFINFIPFKEEKARQEMILNIKEQLN
ncbi:MAG: hypothetical protein ACOC44_10010 [Promethearchaeia archaeon]